MSIYWFTKGPTSWDAQFGKIWIRINFPKYWKCAYILRITQDNSDDIPEPTEENRLIELFELTVI
jgi:hypothetical protein